MLLVFLDLVHLTDNGHLNYCILLHILEFEFLSSILVGKNVIEIGKPILYSKLGIIIF